VKLGQVFDPRNNALNAWRLALATSVILQHSYILTGRKMSFGAVNQILYAGGVDGFFALSGFLITASWLRNPRLRDYLAARALRILPGFYVCLGVTAFIIAPIALAIQGGSRGKLLLSTAPVEYVVDNLAVIVLKVDVGGTPRGVPYPGTWNSSLWTLLWELLCYLVVAVIGIVGLANRRWVPAAILALATFCAALLPPYAPSEAMIVQIPAVAARFAIMFAAGALLYQWRNVIPARWSLVGLSAVVVLAASGLTSNYRVIAGLPLAYALIVSGALIQSKRLRLRTDLSYGVYIYAFPMQQLLVICGLGVLNPVAFAIIATAATVPLAALSWFLVEKPAMSLKARLKRKRSRTSTEDSEHDATPMGPMADVPTHEVPRTL
jgi:peptidoglycan/LPS O-acetylase OafA/YrhL